MAKPQTTKSGQIVPRGQTSATRDASEDAHKKATSLISFITSEKVAASLSAAVPKIVTPERIARMAATAVRTTRDLWRCDQLSFIGCVMQAAQLGLECNTPMQHCFLIPRRKYDKQTRIETWYCSFMLGYQGMIELAMRSGKVDSVVARPVFKGDEFDCSHSLEGDKLVHVPNHIDDSPENLTAVYAICRIKGAAPVFEKLTRARIEARRDRSDAAKKSFSPWHTDFIAMARKTGIRAIWPWIPRSSEMARAVAVEDAHERGGARLLNSYDPDIADALHDVGLQGLEETLTEDDAIEAEIADEPSAADELAALEAELRQSNNDAVSRIMCTAPSESHALNELRALKRQIEAT